MRVGCRSVMGHGSAELGAENRAQKLWPTGVVVRAAKHSNERARVAEPKRLQEIARRRVRTQAVCDLRLSRRAGQKGLQQLASGVRIACHPRTKMIGEGALPSERIACKRSVLENSPGELRRLFVQGHQQAAAVGAKHLSIEFANALEERRRGRFSYSGQRRLRHPGRLPSSPSPDFVLRPEPQFLVEGFSLRGRVE